ncbi:L-lactate dehydrogenase [Georgenia thermotolerans]|uniref:L-lactate dehydrogenase n=1 Tax=Georgenia thermotolerans TaxID=527326 RepID=A0A7J5UNJ8_9MICO|nr:L-lactate dehydrogenase [Georgenia thermotolerans]KAE8763811.1 L-lactate dehydrogenase [Georgenia thermotolerans]
MTEADEVGRDELAGDSRGERRSSKVAIVGAGAVGSTLAYACLLRGAAREVVLFDRNRDKVEAQAMDIAHGIQFTPMGSVRGSDDVAICAGADVVVITAGARQKPGQSRLDLAGATIDIMRTLVPQLVEVAPHAVYVMVANPVDVVTYAGLKISGLPQHQFFGSGTVLDTSRLRYLVARACGVAVQSVHAYMAGEHGDSELPLWSSAMIGAVPLLQWGPTRDGRMLDEEMRAAIATEVVQSAYKIIAGKGATNYAVGLAVVRIIEAVMRNEHRVLSVSSLLEDYLEISDVCMSVPTVVGHDGVGRRLVPVVTERERHGLVQSAEAIRAVARQFGF